MKMFLFLLVALVSGCGDSKLPVSERIEEADAMAKRMQTLGVSGRVVLTWGDSHFAYVPYNLTGTHGFCEIEVKPNDPGE